MANTNDMNTPTKVPCGGFVLGEGLTLGEDGKTLNVSGGGSQADWNQNDESAADYVKNRPFYTGEPVETLLMEETTVSFSLMAEGIYSGNMPIIEIISGNTYNICFDDITYQCIAKTITEGTTALGNQRIMSASSTDTGEPFLIVMNDTHPVIATLDSSPSHTLSIRTIDNEIKQIDSKYLPMASDSEYGVVKKSEIITSYVFSNVDVKVSQMKKAIDDFNNGSARIKWRGDIVISALYEGDTLYIVFSAQPYRTMSMTSSNFYRKNSLNQVSSEDAFMERLYLTSRDSESTYGTISCYGINPEKTIELSANHLDLAYGDIRASGEALLNRKELILQSSTDSSTKKFKITVDDTGTIKATEVTNN